MDSVSETMWAALRLLEKEETKVKVLQDALIEGEESGESNQAFRDIVSESKAELHAE